MALIKCQECGKEISDKAKTCVNCGCPIKDNNIATPKKSTGNKKAIFDENLIKKNSIIKIILIIIIFLIMGIILGNIFSSYTVEYNPRAGRMMGVESFGAIGFITWIVGIVWAILIFIAMNNYLKQELIVDNEKVYGKIKSVFHLLEVNIPINQVSSISMVNSSIPFEPTKLCLSSSSQKYLVGYILNSEEIKNDILNKMGE